MSAHLGGDWGPSTLAVFGALSTVHLTCTYWSLCAVRLESLNSQRLDIVLNHFLDAWGGNGAKGGTIKHGFVPTPKAVAEVEHFVPRWPMEPFAGPGVTEWLDLAPPLPVLARSPAELAALRAALAVGQHSRPEADEVGTSEIPGEAPGYVLSVRTISSADKGNRSALALAVESGAGVPVALRGALHAALLQRRLSAEGFVVSKSDGDNDWILRPELVADTLGEASEAWAIFSEALGASEWSTSVLHLDSGELLGKRALSF